MWPKINREHLLFRGSPYTKLGFNQAKGWRDIEQTTLGHITDGPTDQQVQNNMPHFFQKGALNEKWIIVCH